VKAALFGHNAPLKPVYDEQGRVIGHEEWPLASIVFSVRLSSKESFGSYYFNSPIQLLLSITHNGKTSYGQVEKLTNDKAENISLPLGDLTVIINTTLTKTKDIDGKEIDVLQKIIFNVPGQTIEIEPGITGGEFPLNGIHTSINGYENNLFPSGTATHNDPIKGYNTWLQFSSNSQIFSLSLRTSPAPLVAELRQSLQQEIALDAEYNQIIPGSWVLIMHGDNHIVGKVKSVQMISKADYGLSGKVTQLALSDLSGD